MSKWIERIGFDLSEGCLRLKIALKNIIYVTASSSNKEYRLIEFNIHHIRLTLKELGINYKEVLTSEGCEFITDCKVSIMYEWESCLTIVRNYVYSN